MIEIIAFVTLCIVCLGQMVERFYFGKTMMKQVDDAIKASMSKNVNEYLSATTFDPKRAKEPAAEEENVELANADEEAFDKFIKNQLAS